MRNVVWETITDENMMIDGEKAMLGEWRVGDCAVSQLQCSGEWSEYHAHVRLLW